MTLQREIGVVELVRIDHAEGPDPFYWTTADSTVN